MARIVRFHQLGGPEVLKIEDVSITPPGPGEVTIRVKALGLNRAEALFREGRYLEQPQLPSRLGYEASGIVEAVGSGVTSVVIGDIVSTAPPIGQGKYGVYGEVATVPAQYVIKHPPSLSFVEAAAIWMQYLTAYGALIEIANIQKGDYVIITAASSSVGLAAIQFCKMRKAISIATTRTSAKRKVLLEAGAGYVIATQEEELAARIKEITGGVGARVAFDSVAGKLVMALADAMANRGIMFEYGALSLESTPFPLMLALSKALTMRGYTLFELLIDPARFEKGKQFIFDAIHQGLKPIIAKTFPFEEIVEAHRFLESNQQFGKIVVTVK